MHRFEKLLLWLLRGGVILVLLTPLIRSNQFFFPYIVPRAVFFQIIVEVLFALSIVLIIFFPTHRPRWNFISLSLLLYLVIAILTTITSADPTKSFIGTVERSFGLFHLLHFGALFVILVSTVKNKFEWNILFAISIAVSLYGALDFLIPRLLIGTDYALTTITGNPLYLAVYILFHIFFAFSLFLQTKNRWVKILLGFILFTFMVTILLSNVRGAFVGLSFGILYFIIMATWKFRKIRVHLISVFLILATAYMLVFMNRDLSFVRSNSVLVRVTNFSFSDETIKARFAMWKMAFSGIKEKPFLGWGRENYSLVFNKYFDTSFEKAKVGEAWEDRTHNIFLEELVDGGLLGLSSYFLLFFAIFWTLRKNHLFTAALLAYIIQGFFGVNNLNEHLPFFLLIAYAYSLSQKDRPAQSSSHNMGGRILWAGIMVSAVLLGITPIISYSFTIQPAEGNREMYRAANAAADNDQPRFNTAYGRGKKMLKNFPSLSTELMSHLASALGQSGILDSQPLESPYLPVILTDLKTLVQRNPLEQRWMLILAQYLQYQGIKTKNGELFDEGYTIWKQLNTASPHRSIFQGSLLNSVRLRQQYFPPTSASPRNPSQK